MRNLKLTVMVTIFGLFVFLARLDLPTFTGSTIAFGAMPEDAKKLWLGEITEILGCHCGCDLTLKECEQDDPDCQIRPPLLKELPATTQMGGPSLVQLAGCTCGCGYRLTECQDKHKDCTQRPRIHQHLKRLAIKYGYKEPFLQNTGLSISSAEERMFNEALKGRVSLLYIREGKGPGKSKYIKSLQKFEKQHRERIALISLSLADKEERNLVKHYRIENPSVAMIAPNGAVTALFKGEPPISKLKRGLVSPKMEEILLAIQQGMTTFICVGPPLDGDFKKAKQTTLSAVRKLGGIATAISLDPGDPTEERLLSALRYKDNNNGTPVFVIAPTGLLIERIDGGLTERGLFDSFQKILTMKSGCGRSTITGGSPCQPGYGVTGESSCQ